jgi:predicted enzyme related to lactoylglutathione lyase
MSRVTHFEIPAVNGEKTTQFYKDVFGWEFQRWGQEEYWLATTGDQSEPGINGAIMTRKDPAQPVVNSISVVDIDLTQKKIQDYGGTIVVPKNAIPGVGWLLYFKDIDGNIFGIMQNDPNAR